MEFLNYKKGLIFKQKGILYINSFEGWRGELFLVDL